MGNKNSSEPQSGQALAATCSVDGARRFFGQDDQGYDSAYFNDQDRNDNNQRTPGAIAIDIVEKMLRCTGCDRKD